jgi:hypothetical protein
MNKTILVVLILIGTGASAFAQDLPTRLIPITADDLNRRFEVHGSLGVPLGTVVTIRGEVDAGNRKAYGSPRFLRIGSVSGKELATPITLPYQLASDAKNPLVENTSYELRAFEHGGFAGAPRDDMRKGLPGQELAYAFYSHLVILSSSAGKTCILFHVASQYSGCY